MSITKQLTSLTSSARSATIVSAVTTGSGLAMVLEMIPNDIGKLATVTGIVLSIILIFNHIRKGNIEYLNIKLENKLLNMKINQRLNNTNDTE